MQPACFRIPADNIFVHAFADRWPVEIQIDRGRCCHKVAASIQHLAYMEFRRNSNRTRPQAFTMVELVVVILVVAGLVAAQLPALANTKAKVARVYCGGNLKQVGVAFRNWSDDRAGIFPMSHPASQGGAESAVGIRATGSSFAVNYPFSGPRGVFGMFVVMSNQLATPRILYCPADTRASYFQGTVFGNSTATNTGFYSDFQASYFVGVDADLSKPAMLLSGDVHIGDGATPPVGANVYGEAFSARKFVSLGTNSNWGATSPGWANTQHALVGNVAFVDGSVQSLDTPQLREALNRSGDLGRSAGSFSQAIGSTGAGVNRLQFP